MAIQLESSAFPDGGTIPVTHTCDGANSSPPLSWTGVPDTAKSLVLIADDPDAPHGTWVHWVVFDIPPDTRAFASGVLPEKAMEDGARQGLNDFGHIGYGGPCPPPGPPHRYFLRLYALRKRLELPPGATRAQVEEAMSGWVLDEGQLMGTYARRTD